VTVANFREFTFRDVTRLPGGRCSNFAADDIIVYTKEGRTQILILDHSIPCLKSFDVNSWKCLYSCQVEPLNYVRMYQLLGNLYLFDEVGRIFRVTSTTPLNVQLHGSTIEECLYNDVCVLDSDTLIAVSSAPTCVDLISPTGQLLQRLTIDYEWRAPVGVQVHAGGGIVTVYDGYPKRFDRVEVQSYVVCMSVSTSKSLSVIWTSAPTNWVRNPVIASGVVIVPCYTSFNMRDPGSVILILSLDNGRQLMKFSMPFRLGHAIRNAMCVYEERLFMGCQNACGVVEFQLIGKLTCPI
jgi:hypothetical protein